MNTLIYGQDERLLQWAFERMAFTARSDAKAIGWGDEATGTLKAVVIWDGFSECDCNIHVCSDESGHWLRRPLLIAAFSHPFLQWERRRVTSLIPENNTNAIRFNRHLGFKQEGICRNAAPDGNIILMGMLREECRFILQNSGDNRNGQE